ncbi:type II secretion system F family protein [Paraburkholderia hospita]|uniref:Type II secretion system protein F n=1 Tax=Paraburkholderia hospita TaxID=169430 RepID=A0ABN0F8F4_9BURK|nr:type II secretion system F family protein [Paraburkholderia hospita]EIM94871.1 type II secretion system protein F [Paraburkholderia hospita]OUL74861.1 type II secretion system protein [Paraburkholderia hospita]OUL84192.1 type II secretion system protein [Paraburkholderia hospita]OUL86780.1 type II secretion system protein [Paraburkholderia hospita]SEH70779.1 type II secretion system protein F (GspF) [Paraburkholderia hospita]
MPYEVRALSPDNQIVSLVVDAQDEDDARRQVEARGLHATQLRALRTLRSSKASRGGISLVLFSQELLALLMAGLSIVEGLEALVEREGNARLRGILERLLAGLREGKRFSSLLAEQPDVFPPLYVGIVRAAEGTSDLPRSLQRYVDYQARIDMVRNKLISSAIYPSILFIVGGGVSTFLITFVVPRFATIYEGTGRSLPWMSQALLDWGKFASAHGLPLFAAAVAVAIAGGVAVRATIARVGLVSLLGRLPLLGPHLRIYQLSRLYLTLGMLLEGGIPIVSAMETAGGTISPALRDGLLRARAAVQAGAPLSSSFHAENLTTPISLRMLRVGERSGELGNMLTQSAAFYDGEISRWIDRFTRMFEPLLMSAIGLVVGTIVVLLYMPIFDLAEGLS